MEIKKSLYVYALFYFQIKCIDSNFLYFIRIIPRKSLYELCPSEDMQALWYFVKQSCVSRKTRIIPSLE